MNQNRDNASDVPLGRMFLVFRWLVVPLFVVVAVAASITQPGFTWQSGPYTPFLGAWLLGYSIWAGQTVMGNSWQRRTISTAIRPSTTRQEFEQALAQSPSRPGAWIEIGIAILVLLAGMVIPEAGFWPLVLVVLHLIFVLAWRMAIVPRTHVDESLSETRTHVGESL